WSGSHPWAIYFSRHRISRFPDCSLTKISRSLGREVQFLYALLVRRDLHTPCVNSSSSFSSSPCPSQPSSQPRIHTVAREKRSATPTVYTKSNQTGGRDNTVP